MQHPAATVEESCLPATAASIIDRIRPAEGRCRDLSPAGQRYIVATGEAQ